LIFDNIDWSKEYDFLLILTKKNKEPIAILKEAYNRTLERNAEALDKLKFSIPKTIKNRLTHLDEVNPNYDKVIEENMVLLKCIEKDNPNNVYFSSYFVIKSSEESSDERSKSVECSSREVMLNKNIITLDGVERQLKKDDVNIADGIFDFLESETTWKLGYLQDSAKVEHIKGGTNNKYRWFDSLSKPWLPFLQEDVCSAFNVIL
jgi:hypothetical protein